LLFRGEVIGDESIASWLNDLQVTTKVHVANSDSAYSDATAMADRNRNRLRSIAKDRFGLARRSWNDFDLPESRRTIGQLQAGRDSTFCSPSPQTPVGAALGKAKAAQASSLVLAKPIVRRRHIRFGLFQPIYVHH
jgi:hypothetical protein